MARRRGFDIEGMDELVRAVKELEKVPTKVAGKAARAGAKIAFKSAKANAPVDTGNLKGGLVMRAEKTTKKGKKVFDIKMDPAKNDVFVKETATGIRYYYPSSQEYGYFTVSGRYIPGFRYLRKAITENERAIETAIVKVGVEEITKALRAR